MSQNFLIENLKFQRNSALDGLAMMAAENATLRAEVERLAAINKVLNEQIEKAKFPPEGEAV